MMEIDPAYVKVEEEDQQHSDDNGNTPTGNGADFRLSSPNSSSSDLPSSFVCQQCNSSSDTFEQFIQHMRIAHLQHIAATGGDGSVGIVGMGSCCCPICGLEQSNRIEAAAHMSEHYTETRSTWQCKKCGGDARFAGVQQLRDHLAQCHAHTLHRCAICLALFTQRDELIEHLMMEHSDRKQVYRCVACEMDFDHRMGLELHIGQVHVAAGGRHAGSSSGTFRSNGQQTKRTMPMADRRAGTVKKESGSSNGEMPTKSAKLVQFSTAQQTRGGGLKCVVCDQQCADELALDTHRLHTHCKVPQGNQCGVCRAPLRSVHAFVQHSLAHRNTLNEMSCVVCRQSVRGDVQLELHARYHLGIGEKDEEEEEGKDPENGREGGEDGEGRAVTEEQQQDATVTCQTCKMNVPKDEYARHLLLHVVVGNLQQHQKEAIVSVSGSNALFPGGIEHQCVRCGRQFDAFARLNAHMLEHLRERINNDKNSEKNDNDEKEEEVAGGDGALDENVEKKVRKEGPIRCDKCKQTFGSRARFIIHRRRHNNKMGRTKGAKCRICDRQFPSMAQLEMHHSYTHSANLAKPTTMGMMDG